MNAAKSNYNQLVHSNPDHANCIVVNWCLGNTCNYSCSYCTKDLHDGSKSWTSLDTAKNFVNQIINHYGDHRKFYFEFTGGEVSLWASFLELAQFIKEQNCYVGLISNASRSLSWWEKSRPLLDHVCISFHPETAKEAHFYKVAEFLSQSLRLHVNIMMLPEKFDYCFHIAETLKKIPNISMALQPLIINFETDLYPYTSVQKKIIDNQFELVVKHIKSDKKFEYFRGAMVKVFSDGKRIVQSPQEFISSQQNNWEGWMCNAGIEQIVVDMEGNIFRGWCRVGGEFGFCA